MSEFGKAAIVGGGLAGCECAMRLARAGVEVALFEMKPHRRSLAHVSDGLAELVCSNSLRSNEPETGVGLLKMEMRALGSLLLEAAEATRVPAGKALAVDRDLFSEFVTRAVEAEPNIRLERREILSLDDDVLRDFDVVVLAAGPLASESLSASLAQAVGAEHLYFYDAIAPIVETDSVDMDVCWWASRYNPEEKDYLNCPMDEAQYLAFRQALLDAEKVPAHDFEKEKHFDGCMPIEALAERGAETLAFGPFKPVGLENPRTGEQHHAVVQLRPENEEKTQLNIVGCQTKLKYGEQERVFRLIPGLENVSFTRFGSVHRNTFVQSPQVLRGDLSLVTHPRIFLAGQITGVEGYVESAACGLWLGIHLSRVLRDLAPVAQPPRTTALGSLLGHLRSEARKFQPSNANFGLMEPLNRRAPKRVRKALYAERAQEAFSLWLAETDLS